MRPESGGELDLMTNPWTRPRDRRTGGWRTVWRTVTTVLREKEET
jgi:hypothetical protein